MQDRRGFLRACAAGSCLAAGTVATPALAATAVGAAAVEGATAGGAGAVGQGGAGDRVRAESRGAWLAWMERVAGPVLERLARGQLRAEMPVECPGGSVEERRRVTHLEAFGRTLAGVGPWLGGGAGAGAGEVAGVGLAGPASGEAAVRRKWQDWTRRALEQATEPGSADHLRFDAGAQNLVDAAFLAHGLMRAGPGFWESLPLPVRERVLRSLEVTRKFRPGRNNWLLFSAMVEAFLARAGAAWRPDPIETAVRAHEEWYQGDGAYGDGPEFHWDYYNSYVIQPMLLDVLEGMGRLTDRWAARLPAVRSRARRYAAVQERLVAPDGTFPVLGRSMAYRCGAFQLLAQMALRRELPDGLSPAQVRGALTAVIGRTLGAPGTFDARGWLRVGLSGHQPGLGEGYISTGSLYLCAAVFLPLGLPESDPFWTGPVADWTARRAWSGADLGADHALRG